MNAEVRREIQRDYEAWKPKMLAALETNNPKVIAPMENEPSWRFFSAALMLELYNGTVSGRAKPVREADSGTPTG